MLINFFLLVLLLVSSITDLKYNKIFNAITFPGIILGFLLNISLFGTDGFKTALFGSLTGFLILLLFFYAGGLGGGDIKLLTAIGALKGFPFILYATLYSALIGGIFALYVVIKQGILLQTFKSIFIRLFSFVTPGKKMLPEQSYEQQVIPYGCAISLGTVVALLVT